MDGGFYFLFYFIFLFSSDNYPRIHDAKQQAQGGVIALSRLFYDFGFFFFPTRLFISSCRMQSLAS
jgi:hypothetical protein